MATRMRVPKSVLKEISSVCRPCEMKPGDVMYFNIELGDDAWKIYEKWISGTSGVMVGTLINVDSNAYKPDRVDVMHGVAREIIAIRLKLVQDHALEMGVAPSFEHGRPHMAMEVSSKVAYALTLSISSAIEPYDTIKGLPAGTFICNVLNVFQNAAFSINIAKK